MSGLPLTLMLPHTIDLTMGPFLISEITIGLHSMKISSRYPMMKWEERYKKLLKSSKLLTSLTHFLSYQNIALKRSRSWDKEPKHWQTLMSVYFPLWQCQTSKSFSWQMVLMSSLPSSGEAMPRVSIMLDASSILLTSESCWFMSMLSISTTILLTQTSLVSYLSLASSSRCAMIWLSYTDRVSLSISKRYRTTVISYMCGAVLWTWSLRTRLIPNCCTTRSWCLSSSSSRSSRVSSTSESSGHSVSWLLWYTLSLLTWRSFCSSSAFSSCFLHRSLRCSE